MSSKSNLPYSILVGLTPDGQPRFTARGPGFTPVHMSSRVTLWLDYQIGKSSGDIRRTWLQAKLQWQLGKVIIKAWPKQPMPPLTL